MTTSNSQEKKTFAPLTDRTIKNLKSSDKPIRRFDGQGLYIEVSPVGKKSWRFKAKLKNGKPILMTLGEYPYLSLLQARQKREELRLLILDGKDPRQVIREQEQTEKARAMNTLRKVTEEWLKTKKERIANSTLKKITFLLNKHVLTVLGDKPITDIKVQDIKELLLKIQETTQTGARKCKGHLTNIFAYAGEMEIVPDFYNPALRLTSKSILKPHTTKHRTCMSITELPQFIAALEKDSLGLQVKTAMYLIMVLFVRLNEVRTAEWAHIDFDNALWTVPAANTKKRREQIYPLPNQIMMMLKDLHQLTGTRRYIFSGYKDKPLGSTTLQMVITRIGFYKKMTNHGFRALATSWLDERGYNRQAIERQLSHLEQGQTNQAYHRADYMEERIKMLQDWANYIFGIRQTTITPEIAEQAA